MPFMCCRDQFFASIPLQLWQYEGSKTLAHYLRRRDCNQRLAEDLGVSDDAVIPTVLKQLFESLAVRRGPQ